MKILNIIPSVNHAGGGPIEGVKQLCMELISRGHTMEVACLDAPDDAVLSSFPFKVYALGPAILKYRFAPKLVTWLKANAHGFDVVIVNGIWQYVSFATRQALVGTGVPYFVFTHGMLDPWFKHTYPLKHLKKWLYWPWAEYRVLRDAKAVIFTCEEERLLARESFWLYKVHEAVMSFGVFNPSANESELTSVFLVQNPHLQGKRIVLFLSRIHEKKGCDLLIRAFAKIAHRDESLHLVMAGPDQTGWAKKLKAQAEELGITCRLTWLGMLGGDMKWGAFYASEVFCLPSHQENFGIVVVEALACGKPVLISNKVNIWREIEADGAGFVADDTLEGTVANLEHWLALDADGYAAMKERARRCFKFRFHIQRAAERLVELIRECGR